MSKIFEALKKAEGDVAETALPVVTGEPGEQAERSGDGVNRLLAVEPWPDTRHSAAGDATELRIAAPSEPKFATVAIRVAMDKPLLPFDGSHLRASEQYKIARTKLIQHPKQPRLIVISSPAPGDGKTISAINLAGALGLKSEAPVLLVEADFRHASLASLLGLPEMPGLGELLTGSCSLEEAVVRVEQFPNLYVMPAGKASANPTELLDSRRWPALCDTFRQQFHFTVLDTPPIAAVADYDLIQACCDGVVVVVRLDQTNRNLCFRALKLVPSEKLIGVLINCLEDWFLARAQGYYYYYDAPRG